MQDNTVRGCKMNWNAATKRYQDWEGRFTEWAKTQPEYAGIVSCTEHKWRVGSFAGWSDQVMKNQAIDSQLRQRYQQEVEPAPNVNFTVICG